MNRLESAVRAVMRAVNLADLAAAASRIGISQPQLSRILSGKIGLTPKTLRRLVTGISPDPVHQFTIFSAHAFDEAERAGLPLALLKIEFQDAPPSAVSFADLPEDLQKQLRLIADEITAGDAGLGGALGWIAGMIEAARAEGTQTHLAAAEPASPYSDAPGKGTMAARQAIAAAKSASAKSDSKAS